MKKLVFFLLFLLVTAFLIVACSPAITNNTTAVRATTVPETTAAPKSTVTPEIVLSDSATIPDESVLSTESSSAADFSFGNLSGETDELLCFPDLPWGTSLDEVLNILELEKSHYELLDQLGRQTILLNNAKWFGITSSQAMIAFDDDMLTTIYICYPTNGDMQAVKENLESIYGSPSDGYTYYRRRLPQEVGYQNDIVVPTEYESNEQRVFWVSDVHYNDYLGEEKTADWVYHMRAHNTGSTAEAYEKIADLNSFSSILWSTNGAEDAPFLNSQNVVVLACDLLILSAAD